MALSPQSQAYFNLYSPQANDIATQYGIPPAIFQSLVNTESGFNPTKLSPKGAIGLAQLMPTTAASLGVNPFDPVQNLTGGADYLSQQYAKFGNWQDALAAYNAGPGNIAAGQSYASTVLAGAGLSNSGPPMSLSGTDLNGNPVGSTGNASGAQSGPLDPLINGALKAVGLPGTSSPDQSTASTPSTLDSIKDYGVRGLLILGAVILGLIGVYVLTRGNSNE